MSTRDLFSEIEVKKSDKGGSFLGYGSCVVAKVVKVNFTIRSGKDGKPFAALPSHKAGEKWFNDVNFPDKEVYSAFQSMIIKTFEAL